MDNSNSDKSKKKSLVLVFLWAALPIALFVVVLFFCALRYRMFCDLYGSFASNAQEKTQYDIIESLLSAGIGIVTLAVSVWIGLNIYNTVSKKDLEETTEKIRVDLEKELNEEEDKLKKRLISSSQYPLFLSALNTINHDMDKGISKYFYEKFDGYNWEKDLNIISFADLLDVERMSNEMWRGSNTSSPRELVKRLDDLERIANDKNDYSKERKILKDYYYVKKISAYYCLLNRQNDINDEDWSAFNGLCQEFFYNIKKCGTDKLEDDQLYMKSITHNKGLLAAVYAMFGYTALRLHKTTIEKNKGGSKDSKDAQTIKVLNLFENASKLETDNSVYCNNLGVWYQQEYSNIASNTDKKAEGVYAKANHNYELAIKKDRHNYKAYNNLGALMLIKIDLQYMSRKKGTNNFRSFKQIAKDIKTLPNDKKREIKENINESITYFQTSRSLEPTFVDSYYNLGKAYFYQYLINNQNEESYYKDAIKECLIAKNIDPESRGWKFVLRNIYEIKDQYFDKAKQLNQDLNKEGDSSIWEKYFGSLQKIR